MVDCAVCAFQTSPHSLYGTLSPFFLTNTVRIFNQSINELRQLAKSPIYLYIYKYINNRKQVLFCWLFYVYFSYFAHACQ